MASDQSWIDFACGNINTGTNWTLFEKELQPGLEKWLLGWNEDTLNSRLAYDGLMSSSLCSSEWDTGIEEGIPQKSKKNPGSATK